MVRNHEKSWKIQNFNNYQNECKIKTTERFSKFLRSLENWERVVDGISRFFMMGKKCDTASFSFCMHIIAYKINDFLRWISPWKVVGWAFNGEIHFSTQERCKLRYSPCIPENLTRIRPLAKLLAHIKISPMHISYFCKEIGLGRYLQVQFPGGFWDLGVGALGAPRAMWR